MDQSKKRERATNFNISEVRLLTELVAKYRSVIENKKNDAVSNKEKDDAWKKIATTFNATSSGDPVRTPKTLKLKYESLKKCAKKQLALHRQKLHLGGGPCTAPDINYVDEKVLPISFSRPELDARNDSDNIADVQPGECPVVLPILPANIIHIEEAMVDETIDFNMNQGSQFDESSHSNNSNDEDDLKDPLNKWGTWNPKFLKSNVSQVLKPNNVSVTAKFDQLSAARLELVQLQIEIAKKEHSFVEEQHRRKMLNLQCDEVRKVELQRLQIEVAKKEHSFVEEEHKRKMLKLQCDEVRKEELHQSMLKKMQQKTLIID